MYLDYVFESHTPLPLFDLPPQGLPKSGRKSDIITRLRTWPSNSTQVASMLSTVIFGSSAVAASDTAQGTGGGLGPLRDAPPPTGPAPSTSTAMRTAVASSATQRSRKRKKTVSPAANSTTGGSGASATVENRRIVDIMFDLRTGEASKSSRARRAQGKRRRRERREAARRDASTDSKAPDNSPVTEGAAGAPAPAAGSSTDPIPPGNIEDTSTDPFAPQLQLINGQVVINDTKTQIVAETPSFTDYKVVDTANSNYKAKAHTNWEMVKKWTSAETQLFYAALKRYKMQFDFIATLFPHRNHRQILKKFKKEERRNARRVEMALRGDLPIEESVACHIQTHVQKRKEAAEKHMAEKAKEERARAAEEKLQQLAAQEDDQGAAGAENGEPEEAMDVGDHDRSALDGDDSVRGVGGEGDGTDAVADGDDAEHSDDGDEDEDEDEDDEGMRAAAPYAAGGEYDGDEDAVDFDD